MKVILVLGAAVWADGPSPTMRRRAAHAIDVWRRDEDQILVPCGGLGVHPPTEAAAMADLFRAAGVPKGQIITEDQSTTTLENIQLALRLLDMTAIEAVTIVTDRYHLPRAWMVARTFGITPRLSAPSMQGAHRSTQVKQYLREAGAIPAYALKLLHFRLFRSGGNDT